MSSRLPRALLLALAVSQGFLGVWAVLAPRSFYDGFPGGGRGWVAKSGAYDAHLVVDVGALSLALTVVLVGAAWLADPRAAALAGGAFLAWSVPHLVFHLGHDGDHLGAGDRIASDGGQALTVAVALFILLTSIKESRSWPASTSSPSDPAASSSASSNGLPARRWGAPSNR